MFDIDDFKHINDEHGHDAGDAVLCELATLVSGYIRETDIFARYGGEEFIIMATETGPEAAQAITEKLRLTIEQHEFGHAGRLTASFGVIGWRAGDSLDSLLKRVDESLYQAKKQGKNRVFATGS